MKNMFLFMILLAAIPHIGWSQHRDRRADLEIECAYNINISTTGQLWLADRCGNIWTADSIGDTWRTVFCSKGLFEHVAAFGYDTAVATGHLNPGGTVLRTVDGGRHWETIQVDKNLVWVHGLCYHPDGKLWIASASGRSFKSLSYSCDKGHTFVSLNPSFVNMKDEENGIEELFMADASIGFAGTYSNGLYYTTDNWRTANRIETPLDQNIIEKSNSKWINRIRLWKQWLIVTEGSNVAYTDFGTETHWQPMPLPVETYEIDTTTNRLWVVTEKGQLVLMEDMKHWEVVLDEVHTNFICGTLSGRVYLCTPDGVVRVSPEGQADTCGFFTVEKTLDDVFDDVIKEYEDEAYWLQKDMPTFSHGGLMWRTDKKSVFLHDSVGWYRIAKPLGIDKMKPDHDRSDRVIILCHDKKNYSVDTSGHIEPYIYPQPTASFVKSGLKSVTINTFYGGCFSGDGQKVSYSRKGDMLYEKENTVDESHKTRHSFAVDSIEQALLRLGECYNRFPSPEDFGLKEGDVNLENVFRMGGWCSSYTGYIVTFVNRDGEIMIMEGISDADCGDYYPWLLPMNISWRDAAFVSYQPMLWQALLPLMPAKMMLREHLLNYSFMRPCDLLFFSDTNGMGSAIHESTGQYTHVAIVESVGDTIWIIEATPEHGVSRRPFNPSEDKTFPDIYRLDNIYYNANSVLAKARSYIGQPYDNAFLPDNGALYCSELVYECFIDNSSKSRDGHIFKAAPMNWRNTDGDLPEYWVRHFENLKIPVPEGVMGTNPTDLSRSPLLRKL